MRRVTRLICIAMVLTLFAAACGDGEDATGTTTSVETTAASDTTAAGGDCETVDQIKMGFPGFPPNFIQSPSIIADVLGFYADNCLEVEFTSFESGAAAFRAMAAGEMDAGMSGTVAPILAFPEGANDVIFGSPGALLDFVVIAVGDLKTCEDLEGAEVVTEGPGGLQHAIQEAFLATCGLDIDTDVTLVIGESTNFKTQIAAGAIQATNMHIDEALFLQEELGLEFNILSETWKDLPDFHYSAYATERSVLEAKRDQFVRLDAAVLRAGRWLKDPANRDQAITEIMKITEFPEDIVVLAYEGYAAYFPTTCEEALPMSSFQFLIDLQVTAGNMAESYPASDVVDLSVCQDAEVLLAEQGY